MTLMIQSGHGADMWNRSFLTHFRHARHKIFAAQNDLRFLFRRSQFSVVITTVTAPVCLLACLLYAHSMRGDGDH